MTPALFRAISGGDRDTALKILMQDPGLAHARQVRTGADGHRELGPTPLQAVATKGDLGLIRTLVDDFAVDIYQTAEWGYPAVAHAHWDGPPESVAWFLGEGATHSTLLGAPTYGLGIDVNLAARFGWLEVVLRHLCQDRLAVHRRGVIGETPLHWAGHDGHLGVVTALIEAGADLEADEIGLYGGKPLHWAAEHSPEVVAVLLANGARVDSRNELPGDRLGLTPLMHNARQPNDSEEATRRLLDAGADPRATDAAGRTALDHAREGHLRRITALLESL